MWKKANRMLALLMTAVLTIGNFPVYVADAGEDNVTVKVK